MNHKERIAKAAKTVLNFLEKEEGLFDRCPEGYFLVFRFRKITDSGSEMQYAMPKFDPASMIGSVPTDVIEKLIEHQGNGSIAALGMVIDTTPVELFVLGITRSPVTEPASIGDA